jgi:hypothetical protein
MSKTLLQSFQELLWGEEERWISMIRSIYQTLDRDRELSIKQAKVLSWRVEASYIKDFPWDQIRVRKLTPEDLVGEDVRTVDHLRKFFSNETLADVVGQLEEGKKCGKRAPVFLRILEVVDEPRS